MYSIRLRYIRLCLARCIGYSHHWLTSGWRPPLFLLMAAAAVTAPNVWLGGLWPPIQGEVRYWWDILAIYVLIVLLLWAWRATREARKRVVIEEFVDHTNEQFHSAAGDTNEQPDSATKGADKLPK